jgi:hypothetical protein
MLYTWCWEQRYLYWPEVTGSTPATGTLCQIKTNCYMRKGRPKTLGPAFLLIFSKTDAVVVIHGIPHFYHLHQTSGTGPF